MSYLEIWLKHQCIGHLTTPLKSHGANLDTQDREFYLFTMRMECQTIMDQHFKNQAHFRSHGSILFWSPGSVHDFLSRHETVFNSEWLSLLAAIALVARCVISATPSSAAPEAWTAVCPVQTRSSHRRCWWSPMRRERSGMGSTTSMSNILDSSSGEPSRDQGCTRRQYDNGTRCHLNQHQTWTRNTFTGG